MLFNNRIVSFARFVSQYSYINWHGDQLISVRLCNHNRFTLQESTMSHMPFDGCAPS